jgi:hypothetical protein
MNTEIQLEETRGNNIVVVGKLYSNRPIEKRDLKKAGARQTRVGGPWCVYQEQADNLTRMGYILTTAPIAKSTDWRQDAATQAQREYLVRLHVAIEPGMTKGRASELIEAAKSGEIESIGGQYTEGQQSIGERY